MKGKERTEQTKAILTMYLAGKSNAEIEREMNLSRATVSSAVSRGRDYGLIPPKRKRTKIDKVLGGHIRRGSISAIIAGLDQDQANWLIDQALTLKCETISEFISEIILDAYFEDQAKK